MESRCVRVGDISVGEGPPLVLIAGPCVLEDESTVMTLAERLVALAGELEMPYIFKASFDKANRTSVSSYRGPGLDDGLAMLAKVKERFGCPVLSDIHQPGQAERAAEVLDVLQVPAFLCRQTDLLLAAGATGRPVNVKKGQFMAPWDMQECVRKIESTGNTQITLTERGSTFGYNNLVVDMRSLAILRGMGYPVIFDATHSVQLPGGQGSCSGGQSEFVAPLIRAAVGAGCDGLFIETHLDPAKALCDGPNMLPLDELPAVLNQAKAIHAIVSE